MLEKEDMRGQQGLARAWVRRYNHAVRRLDFEQRDADRAEVISIIEGTRWTTLGAKYVDLNDGLAAFEDVIHATLPELPPPDVALDYADEGSCEECGGEGVTTDPMGQPQPCPTCGGDGIVPLHTDLKCEAYLRMTFRPDVGNVRSAVEDILWDDFSWGIGWGKIVWRRQPVKTPAQSMDAPDAEDQRIRAAEEIGQVAERDDDNHAVHIDQHEADIETILPEVPERLSLAEHIANHKRLLDQTVLQYPELQRVGTDEIVYDPFARRWKDVAWVAEVATERVADIKKIPGVRNVTEENLPRNEVTPHEDQTDEDLPYDEARVDVIKIHDRRKNRFILLPKRGVGEADENVLPLLDVPWPYPNDVYIPIVTRRNGRKSLHGISTLVLCKNILQELARINQDIRRHAAKHAQYKRVYGRGTLDDKAIKSLDDPNKTLAFVPQSAGVGEEIKPPPIPATLLERRGLLMDQLKALLGSSNESTGADNPHQITATEASVRAERYDAKVTRKQGRVADFLGTVGLCFLEDYRQFGDTPMPLMIDTATGRELGEFSPSDVPLHLRVSFDVTAATAEAKASRQQQQQNYYTMLMQSGVGDPRKTMEEWGRGIDIRDPSRLFMDMNQPMMQPPGSQPAIPSDKSAPPAGQVGQPQLKIAGQPA